jgi:DNA-binding response OmpR family regulator
MPTPDTPLTILVVEDNDNLRESIVDALGTRGHRVWDVDCAEAVAEVPELARLDMAILDLNLPGEDGLSLANRLRSVVPRLGIIMLTARTQGEDRAAGYAQGADIYLTKPASLDELEHAIGALSRRLQPNNPLVHHPQSARLDRLARLVVHADGSTHRLTEHEAALLNGFAVAAGHALENWQIAELVGMDLDQFNKSALELHIVRLRKKLPSPPGGHSPIQALRGRGYQLCVPVQLG